jgi:hypothetical protein
LALQTPKFYLAGSKKSRKSGFLRSIDRKNPHLKQALSAALPRPRTKSGGCISNSSSKAEYIQAIRHDFALWH